MPSGDRTGPLGQGPGTGRVLGYCQGYDSPGYANGFGRGTGRGRGFGRGQKYRGSATGSIQTFPVNQSVSKEDEIKMLKSQAEYLNRTQKDIEKRLSELEPQSE